MSNLSWKPSASLSNLKTKNQVISKIRQYFSDANVLEVDTPILSRATITDVHLDGMSTLHTNPLSTKKTTLYLQTSPEYFMKRMLCAGYPSMFQIAKCFRDDEVGIHHSPEFTMLEWYRVGFTMDKLITEIDELLRLILGSLPLEKITYENIFKKYLSIDIFGVSKKQLVTSCELLGFADYAVSLKHIKNDSVERDMLLQLLFSEKIEPMIGNDRPVVVTHFPASQASLAAINKDDARVSQRFELYYKGMELANGFEELGDPEQLKTRFERDNQQRQLLNKSLRTIDQHFIEAHEEGLPDCSGVALGLDRLLMIKCDSNHISEVQSFSYDII